MKVALFSWETLHSIAVGGVGVHVTELAAGLQRRGHDVHVFTRQGAGQSLYDCIHGVHYHRCPFALHPNFVDEVNNMCRSFVHHCTAVEDSIGRFDIIHAHDWLASNAMVWLKDGRGHRGVLTIHSTEYGRNGNRHFGGQASRVAAAAPYRRSAFGVLGKPLATSFRYRTVHVRFHADPVRDPGRSYMLRIIRTSAIVAVCVVLAPAARAEEPAPPLVQSSGSSTLLRSALGAAWSAPASPAESAAASWRSATLIPIRLPPAGRAIRRWQQPRTS